MLSHSLKGSINEKFYGNLKNRIDITIRSDNLLKNKTAIGNLKIWFEVRSGDSKDNLSLRGEEEKAIEAIINQRYQQTKLLTISGEDKFKYYTYYNLAVCSQLGESPEIYTDSITIFFIRQSPICKITTGGVVFNPYYSIAISSDTSKLDFGSGDDVAYYWSCEECQFLISKSPCSCDIFKNNIERKSRNIEIEGGMASDMSKYIISLTISLQNSGNVRSCYSTIEILTMNKAKPAPLVSILPGYGGSNITKSEVYFVADISKIQDLQIGIRSYEWVLLEIVNRSNPSIKYSDKDKFYAKILKNDYNIDLPKRRELRDLSSSSGITPDITPRILASPQSLPLVLGIARDDVKLGFSYSYGLNITYADGKSPAYSSINFDAPAPIPMRYLQVVPESGVEYQSLFTFTFPSSAESDSSDISYIFYRKDCPNSNSTNFTAFSIILKNTNSFSTILSQGLAYCDHQVLIKLRIISGNDFIETSTTLKVLPYDTNSKNAAIKSWLIDLESNTTQYSLAQAMAMLQQISSVSTLNVISSENFKQVFNTLAKYDTYQIESILASLNPDEQVNYFEHLLIILLGLTRSSQTNFELITAVITKVYNYVEKAKKISGGTKIFEDAVATMSSVADFLLYSSNSASNEAKKQIYNQIVNILDTLVQQKLTEIIPGGHVYQIASPNIAISIKVEGFSSFVNTEKYLTISNQTIYLPAGLKIMYNNNSQRCETSLCAISTVLYSLSFNPYQDIKNNTNIDTEFLTNSSTINEKVNKSTIKQIYSDLRNTTKLDLIVDRQKVYSKVLFISFYAGNYSLQSKLSLFDTTLAIDELVTSSTFKAQILLTQSAAKDKISPKIPVFYIAANNSWSNSRCELNFSIDSSSSVATQNINSPLSQNVSEGYALITCGVIGFKGQSQYPRASLVLAIDSIENFDDIAIFKGNKKKEAFSTTNAIPIVIASGITMIAIIFGLILYKLDNSHRLPLSIEALYHYEPKTETTRVLSGSCFDKLGIFFTQLRKVGFLSVCNSVQLSEGSPGVNINPNAVIPFGANPKVFDERSPQLSIDYNTEVTDRQEMAFMKDIAIQGTLTGEKADEICKSLCIKRYTMRYVEEKNDKMKASLCSYLMVKNLF